MIFPSNPDQLEYRVKWLIDRCMDTRDDRNRLYDWREKYYLYGTAGYQQARYNRIRSHIDLVKSFLYAPNGSFYHIAAENNADDLVIKQAMALEDSFNEDFFDTFISSKFSDALEWAISYDSMLLKMGWNRSRNQLFAEIVPPHNFGVYREDLQLEDQTCFVHKYPLDYQEAVEACIRARRTDMIPRLTVLNKPKLSQFPLMMQQRMIIASTGGTNLSGNIFGQVNPDYSPVATYQPETEVPLVWFSELWAWDTLAGDWRIFHMLDPDVLIGDSMKTIDQIQKAQEKGMGRKELWGTLAENEDLRISDTNYFIPGEHPFVHICPFPKYNYFWGVCHLDSLIPLQEWMLERLEQIADILEKQAYPARSFSGFGGLTDERAAAFGGADSYVFDQLPGAKVEEHSPTMPPDIFAEFSKMENMFLEASGLTELLGGKGEQGVRSGSHAQQLKKTGGGRIQSTAEKLKPALVRMGDIALKLKVMHDDTDITPEEGDDGHKQKFRASEMSGPVKMRVEGHEYSPLFSDESEAKAMALKKLGAIDDEMLVRSLRPGAQANIIHRLRQKAKKEAQMVAQHPELLAQKKGGRKR
jgi:hypothetical protein